MLTLLAMSGSLRTGSTNSALLRAVEILAPLDCRIVHYAGLAELPHFNPDFDVIPAPQMVARLRAQVQAADGLVISSPEYARGIPGSFKNALDWLVSSPEIAGKPVALINASPRGTAAQEALRLVLTTIATRIVDEASVALPLLGKVLSGEAIAADAEIGPAIRVAMERFSAAIRAFIAEEE
jgi:chromate reductase, NAD(P)H dehydrogenase (quinone)